MNIANTNTAQQDQTYWNNQNQAWGVQNQATQNAQQNAQTQEQQQWAEQMAQMYQPQQQSWYQPLINAAATGVGYAAGGPLGGALGAYVSNLVSPNSGTSGYSGGSLLNANGYTSGSNPWGYSGNGYQFSH